jgi:hypothetical protein
VDVATYVAGKLTYRLRDIVVLMLVAGFVADRVFWIVDNGSSHRDAVSVNRMTRTWPNAHLIHLPRHTSWLD